MPRPAGPPIGLKLAATAKTVSKAFDQALASAGGSLPMWLVLLSVKTRQRANQRQLAAAIGIQGATLTHHLNAMEDDGLLTRRRDPTNRRVHVVELTALGETAFDRLRDAAMSFDQRLRTGLDAEQLSTLGSLLDQLASNVTVPGDHLAVPQGPGAGLGS